MTGVAGGVTPSEHFGITLFNGNNTTVSTPFNASTEGGLFWISNRQHANGNFLIDSVRGVTQTLFGTDTSGQVVRQSITAFNSSNVTVGTYSSIGSGGSGTNVLWSWRGGGTASSNSNGSITSSVSANVDAGFSIVTYSGASTTSTVGHGLSAPPQIIIVKALNLNAGYPTLFNDGSSSFGLRLNTSNASDNANKEAFFGNGSSHIAPTSSVFTVGNVDETNQGYNYVAYCWTPITGYSHFGTYDGTDDATKSITGLGFTPRLIAIKCHNGSSQWNVLDSVRGVTHPLEWNNGTAEQTRSDFLVSFDSDGFTVAGDDAVSDAGRSFIYLAWA